MQASHAGLHPSRIDGGFQVVCPADRHIACPQGRQRSGEKVERHTRLSHQDNWPTDSSQGGQADLRLAGQVTSYQNVRPAQLVESGRDVPWP